MGIFGSTFIWFKVTEELPWVVASLFWFFINFGFIGIGFINWLLSDFSSSLLIWDEGRFFPSNAFNRFFFGEFGFFSSEDIYKFKLNLNVNFYFFEIINGCKVNNLILIFILNN